MASFLRACALRGLFHSRSGRDFFFEAGEDGLAVDGGGEEHAVGLDAHELGGREVRDHDDGAADELLGFVGLGDARDDLARNAAHIELELEELFRSLDLLRGGDLRGAQVEGAPTASIAVSPPSPEVRAFTFSTALPSALFTVSVAPNFFATSRRLSSRSIMMMRPGE